MRSLLNNIRFYVLVASILLSVIIYLWVTLNIPNGTLQSVRQEQLFGLFAIINLYLALLAGPFCYTFSWFPYAAHYIKARRALGVSAFYFSFLHTYITFFGQLGGFAGLGFLDTNYVIPLAIGFIALIILLFLTITSLDRAVQLLHFKNWKLLHRFVYLASVFILIHTVMLGSHFTNLSQAIPTSLFLLVGFLLFLELLRIDSFFVNKLHMRRYIIATILGFFLLIGFLVFRLSNNSLAVHSHASSSSHDHYILIATNAERLKAHESRNIQFQIYDTFYQEYISFPKQSMRVTLISRDFSYFSVIPISQKNSDYSFREYFPKDGRYYLYVELDEHFPHIVSTDLLVGNSPFAQASLSLVFEGIFKGQTLEQKVDSDSISLRERFYQSTNYSSKLVNLFSVDLQDTSTKKPITDLEPIAEDQYGHPIFGRMTAINQDTYDYIYLDSAQEASQITKHGGPTFGFVPTINIVTSGRYQLFFEYKHHSKMHVVHFNIKIK